MNPLLELLHQPLARRLGWTLLHSLWQGALVAAAFGLIRSSLRRRSAATRYLVGCLSLLLLAAAPVMTFRLVGTMPELATVHSGGPGPHGVGPAFISAHDARPAEAASSVSLFIFRGVEFLERIIPGLVAAWMIGVMFFSTRLAQGWRRMNELKTEGLEEVDPGWIDRLNELRLRLKLSRPVRLFQSALVEVPTVVGWLRPVILLPASSLIGLTPLQLQAILAHELAHVVRHDYPVNLFQNVVETLMFYHPAVWWISRCIREEREHCCDDVAVRLCGDRVVYVSALATLEELRGRTPALAFAADGGSLLNRVRRLAGWSGDCGDRGLRHMWGLALLGIGLVLMLLGVGLLLAPDRFQAATRLKIHPEFQAAGLATEGAKSGFFEPYFLDTEIETINSPVILERVVADLKLNEQWGKKYNRGVALKTSEVMSRIKYSLDVRPVRKANVVEIVVFDDDPKEAADLANAIGRAYRNYRREQTFGATSNTIAVLHNEWEAQEERVREAQANVDQLREKLKISETDATSLMPAPTLPVETVRQLTTELNLLHASEANQEWELRTLKQLDKSKLREAIQVVLDQPDPQLATLISTHDLYQASLLQAEKEFSPGHPTYDAALKAYQTWDQKINDRIDGILTGLQTKIDRTKAKIEELDKRLEYARSNDLATIQRSRPYYEAKQQLQDLLQFSTILGMKIASQKTDLMLPKSAGIEILDSAVPPILPVSSRQPMGVGLIAVGGLLELTGVVMLKRKPKAQQVARPA